MTYPLHGVVKERVRAEFVGRALSEHIGRPVIVEEALTYEALEQELAANRVDIALATADQCNHFEPRARAVLRSVRAGRWYYHSAFICRQGEALTLDKLQGLRAAWVAPLSMAGYLLPMRYLESQGLSPSELFSEQRFHGTYRRALLAVLSGEADVTAIFATHAEEYMARMFLVENVGLGERRLQPFAFSGPTLADGVIITHRVPETEAAQLVSLLTHFGHNEGGLAVALAPFNIQGFALERDGPAPAVASPSVLNSEYIALDVDAQERCRRVWSTTGMAFGRDLRGTDGLKLEELLPPEASIPLQSLVRSARLNKVGGRMHFRLETGGLTRQYAAEATLRPARPGEEVPDLGVMVRDLTGLDAVEQGLYRLASFPMLHPDPMLELSSTGQLMYANAPAYLSFPDLMGLGSKHPVVVTALAQAQQRPQCGNPALMQFEGRFWEVLAIQHQDNESVRVFAKDVTARKQMEAGLIRSDRLASLGQLATRVGHQMNNPLAFMMANLSFAKEEIGRLRGALRNGKEHPEASGLDEVIDALEESLEGAERLKGIVQDLRMLTREAPRHRGRVNVQHLLEDTLKLVRSELRLRARLEKNFQPVPPVEADEAGLGQVFLNLMLNAVQAMSEQHAARNVLRVATRLSEAAEVIIEVQDTGGGMPPDVLEHLFEPFYTTRPSSTGMGLSVSHAIITSLGGSLRAESQPGEGTLFTISLPAARTTAATSSLPEHSLVS